MKSYLTSHRAAVAVVAGVVAALSFSGAAKAITDTVFKYSAPKTGYFSIHAMAMSPSSDNSDYHNDWQLVTPISGSACFNAAVNLPNGATITGLRVYYQSSTASNPDAHLRRQRLSDGATEVIGVRAFLDDTFQRKAGNVPVNAAFAFVNNGQYSYGFGVCLGSPSDAFYSARIAYTYDNAGD